jgi:hypothetical protein
MKFAACRPHPFTLSGGRGAAGVEGRARLMFLAALLLAACATPLPLDRPGADAGGASSRDLAVAGLRAWVLRGDPATATRRFDEALRRDASDPWARYGAALAARRSLDDAGETVHLVALIEGAPGHPLAAVAAGRLGELAEVAPPLAQAVEAGLARVQSRGRVAGLAALRVRAARLGGAVARGDLEAAERLRVEGGAITAWTLAGPYGALHALDFDTRYPPEAGDLATPAPGGGIARAIPAPDGLLSLDAEGPQGDIFYAAADVTLARGGDYLLSAGATSSLRVLVDGALAVERRSEAGFPPSSQVVPLALGAGRHRVLAKIARGSGRAILAVSLARADGAASGAAVSPAPPAAGAPSVRGAALPSPVNLARDLARVLEREVPLEVARLVAARDALEGDREGAKELLEEALTHAPASPPLLSLRAEARGDDPTLSARVGRARAEADADRALAADPGDAATRLRRADLLRGDERSDDAATLLDALAGADAERPRALVARARLAQARGVSDVAERLAEEARRRGGDCAALELLDEIARARDAVAREDELAAALAVCPRGRERVVEHRRRRGDLAGALAAADEVLRASPARVDARLARADLLVAKGDARAAAEDLAELARLWPRDARVEKRRAEALEAAGDRAGARAARERALLIDGADLRLRRAVALEDGAEPLDDLSEDGAAALAAFRAAPPAAGTAGATVLDFGAVEAHPDGAYTERVHVIVEAKDQRAVDRVGEVSVPAGAEILVARTLKRDGRALEAESPTGEKRTLSLPGLEPGDFAEWEWLRAVPSRGPAIPGFSADPFFFRAETPLWRSSYAAAAPRGAGLAVDARGLPPPPPPREEGGRQVVRVLAERVPALFPEPHAPPESEYVPFVQVGAGAGETELARAVADAFADMFRPSLEVRALAREILASVPEAERATHALPRAAHRRVAEIVLGAGGSLGEGAGAVLSRGRGSRMVLLKSVLDALGVRVRVALVREFGHDPGAFRFPRPDVRDAAVLRVDHGGKVAWVDPSTRGTPYGVLSAALRGADALVLPGPGEAVEHARTPDDDGRERRHIRLVIAVDPRGDAIVEGEERYDGFEAAALRAQIEQLDVEARRQAVEGSLSRAFRSPALLSLDVDGERDLGGPLALRWRARADGWARLEDARAVADAPIFPARLGARFVQRAARESPLLLRASERVSLDVAVALPEGWRPAPRPGVDLATPFGSYRRSERAERGRLVREDAYDLLRARVAPADYPAFARHASAVDAAQETPMVFERSTLGEARPSPAGP